MRGNQPIKIAPAANEPHAKNAANASQVDTVTTGSIEKLVSREEQPVTIVPPKPTSRVISRSDHNPPRLAHQRGRHVRPRLRQRSRGVAERLSGCLPRLRTARLPEPIECRCIERRAFGYRPCHTCQRKQHRGGKPCCFRRRLCCSSYLGAQ